MTVEGLTLVYIIICAFIPFMYSLIHSSLNNESLRIHFIYVTKKKKKKKKTLTHACTEKIVNFIVIHVCMFYKFSIL